MLFKGKREEKTQLFGIAIRSFTLWKPYGQANVLCFDIFPRSGQKIIICFKNRVDVNR